MERRLCVCRKLLFPLFPVCEATGHEGSPSTLRGTLSTLSRAGVGVVVSQHDTSHCAAYSVAGGVSICSG